MGILDGKVAIVTGSAKGIGRATALAYAREGARVVINSRSQADIDRAVQAVADGGGEALGIVADVSRREEVERLVQATLSRWGRVDILVNNAAVLGPLEPVGSDAIEEWRRALEIDLFGCYLMLHRVIPVMARQRRGKVINVTSPNAWRYEGWLTVYGVAKAGLVRMTTGVAAQTAQSGVDVNIVDVVGYTDMAKAITGSKDMDYVAAEYWRRRAERGIVLEPEVNVPIMLWLASPESDGFTGRIVRWTMKVKDLNAHKKEILASPTALRPMLEIPGYIGETETARWYASESAKVLEEIQAEVGRPA